MHHHTASHFCSETIFCTFISSTLLSLPSFLCPLIPPFLAFAIARCIFSLSSIFRFRSRCPSSISSRLASASSFLAVACACSLEKGWNFGFRSRTFRSLGSLGALSTRAGSGDREGRVMRFWRSGWGADGGEASLAGAAGLSSSSPFVVVVVVAWSKCADAGTGMESSCASGIFPCRFRRAYSFWMRARSMSESLIFFALRLYVPSGRLAGPTWKPFFAFLRSPSGADVESCLRFSAGILGVWCCFGSKLF
jgi:hypothetical protein